LELLVSGQQVMMSELPRKLWRDLVLVDAFLGNRPQLGEVDI
jgi:hypothetical protein